MSLKIQIASANTAWEARQKKLEQVGKILAMTDRAKKWRAAVAYYLQEHPEAAQIYKAVIKDCAEKRQGAMLAGMGTTNTSIKRSEFAQNMHARVDVPSFVHYAICTFDPEFATIMSGGEANFAQSKWSKIMRKAFPEFVVYQ